MSEYTPSTEEVREAYVVGVDSEVTARYRAEFDRWLAAHDAEVRAEADNDRDELREFVDGLGEHLSDAWDEDVALEEILQRFVQDYASLDREILAARAEDDFNGVKPIVFVWDQNEGSLVRALSHPAEAERDALAAQLEAVRELLLAPFPGNHVPAGSHIGPYEWVTATEEARAVIAADPSSLLAERDARMRAEGSKQALLDAASAAEAALEVAQKSTHEWTHEDYLTWLAAPGALRGEWALWLRARGEQAHKPHVQESER